jgi:hypothetical protein
MTEIFMAFCGALAANPLPSPNAKTRYLIFMAFCGALAVHPLPLRALNRAQIPMAFGVGRG